jgi:hypothetical protein
LIIGSFPGNHHKQFKAISFDFGLASEDFYKKGQRGQTFEDPGDQNQVRFAVAKGNLYSIIPSSEVDQSKTTKELMDWIREQSLYTS